MPCGSGAGAVLRFGLVAARLGSFKAAATELSVTPTAVSHRIRALEEALGCALFHRQVRAITLTPEGEQLQAGVSRGLQEIAACVDRIRHPVRQTVTVSMTPEFAAQWLVPRLAHLEGSRVTANQVKPAQTPVNPPVNPQLLAPKLNVPG